MGRLMLELGEVGPRDVGELGGDLDCVHGTRRTCLLETSCRRGCRRRLRACGPQSWKRRMLTRPTSGEEHDLAGHVAAFDVAMRLGDVVEGEGAVKMDAETSGVYEV